LTFSNEYAKHCMIETLKGRKWDLDGLEVGDCVVRMNGAPCDSPYATFAMLQKCWSKLGRRKEGRVELDVIPAARVDKAEVSRAELAYQAHLESLMIEARSGPDVPHDPAHFADLATAPGGRFPIADTARRAITLEQLARIAEHVGRRLGYRYVEPVVGEAWTGGAMKVTALGRWERSPDAAGERWFGGRDKDVPITSVEEVTLYDCNTYVILPATAEKECSMVELMASEEQPPHYFVSHWWGEPIVDFLRCLRRHAEARRLEYKGGWHDGEYYDPDIDNPTVHRRPHPCYVGEGVSPRYWVCAHANNQHKLDGEISDDLTQTSFFRAMRLAWGTVSVVDRGAVSYSRIW
ncbi:MAG: hypothetical protein VYD05_03595, partial [Planctomycetota bacterium]|nr:hypothetical protein [Planctomycetota bacterium]